MADCQEPVVSVFVLTDEYRMGLMENVKACKMLMVHNEPIVASSHSHIAGITARPETTDMHQLRTSTPGCSRCFMDC